MAYNRALSGDESGVLVSCSICATRFLYPQEGRYCSDKLLRCNLFCTETETPTDYARKSGSGVRGKRDEMNLPFPVGAGSGGTPWTDPE